MDGAPGSISIPCGFIARRYVAAGGVDSPSRGFLLIFSPLHGATPESLARDEVEFLVTLSGVDETSCQPVHARQTYEHHAITWGARHADVLSEDANGDLVLDLGRFHEVVPTEATETFPYAWQPRGADPVRRSPP